MSLTVFDVSTNHAFVGSPLYARNRVTPNTEAIARVFSIGPVTPFSSLYDYSVTSWPYAANGRANDSVSNLPLGSTSAFKSIKPGWNRLTFLVWGVDVICNPWVLQSVETRTRSNGSVITAYNEAREISLSVFGAGIYTQESIPTYRQATVVTSRTTNPNRIPLNCVHPENASGFASFSSVFRFQRTIKVSVYNETALDVLFFWVNSGGSASGVWTNVIAHQPNTPATSYVPLEQWLPTNETSLNPANPILLNGASTNLFSGVNPSQSKGVAFVLRSSEQDSQYRPMEYADALFQAVS